MSEKHPIYIFGHKNPDADAICAAIGYAAYKKDIRSEEEYIAARCGDTNARIDMILNHFKVDPPTFITDVTPTVSDIMIPINQAKTVNPHSTCAEALEIIDKHDIRALPVISNDNKLEGLISIFNLGQYFIPDAEDLLKMSCFETNLESIARALKAKPIHMVDEKRYEELAVRLGTMGESAFEDVTQRADVPLERTIIVVGSRKRIQKKSIESGARLLIIAANLEVDPEIIELSKEKNVSLMVSPYDSTATAWVIRSAVHVAPLVFKDTVNFSADEKLSSVRRKIVNQTAPLYFVTNKRGELLGIFSKSDILKPSKKRIVLVDHNEISQAVDGAAEVQITEIIDHHRLGNPPTRSPIRFVNEPLGSTSTIIATMYQSKGLRPSASIAGILMGGIISDTLNLRGPTTTDIDRNILPWLSEIAGINVDEFPEMIFKSGSIILTEEPGKVIQSDCKIYSESSMQFSVSQIEELGFSNFWDRSEALINSLEEYREEQSLDFSLLLVTNINTQDSLLIARGNEDVISLVKHTQVNSKNIFELPGIVSRKKQLIPYVSSLLSEGGFN